MTDTGVTAAWLRSEVYPRLDATELLTTLEPARRGKAYHLNCPACGHRRSAYYYPGSGAVICNRQDHCGERTSIWDALQITGGYTRAGDVVHALCSAAGVQPPEGEQHVPQDVVQWRELRKAFIGWLNESPEALAYLVETRKFDRDRLGEMELGFYPDAETVRRKGQSLAIPHEKMVEWDLVPEDPKRRSAMENRIVGFWRQPDGTYRLWGRAIDGAEPKYRFARGLDKSLPYGYRKLIGPLVCVEGTLDRDSLELLGIPSVATGGNLVIDSQADTFAADGIEEILFLLDEGTAAERGALKTIRNCESRGLVTSFGVLEDGDDVDALRANGQGARVRALAEQAVNGGAYLADLIARLVSEGTGAAAGDVLHLQRLADGLTPVSLACYEARLRARKVKLATRGRRVYAYAGRLASFGATQAEIERKIREKFGVELSMRAVDTGEEAN